ncbi:hypothetical protein D3C78_1436690 [compost metagenome]
MREARELVLKAVARGQHQHRHIRAHVVAQRMQHGIAIHARQADVQDQGIEALRLDALKRGVAGVSDVGQEPANFQEGIQVAGNDVIVFDNQHPIIRTRRGADCHG